MMHVPLVHSFTRGSSVVVRPPAGAALQRWRCSGRVVVVRGHAGTTRTSQPQTPRRRLAEPYLEIVAISHKPERRDPGGAAPY